MKKIITALFIIGVALTLAYAQEAGLTQGESGKELSELEVLAQFNPELLEVLALKGRPDEEGAIGRNQKAYFHVRFQLGLSNSIALDLVRKNAQYLEEGIKAIEYAFDHQTSDGTFTLLVPKNLQEEHPTDAKTLEIAQASGTSFFYNDLGRALLLLKESEWFLSSAETAQLRMRLESLRPQIARSLNKLKEYVALLKATDEGDTNRIFFDASAFYLVGSWMHDQEAIDLGIDFLQEALQRQRPDGSFLEKGGFDSSYQAVSLTRALIIYNHLRQQEAALKDELWSAIKRGITWEVSRILPSGEVSTQGNTRVYPGGEKFLGREKQPDALGAAFCFEYYGIMTSRNEFNQLSRKIIAYCREKEK